MSDLSEIKRLVELQGETWEQQKAASDQRYNQLAQQVDELLLKAGRPGAALFGDSGAVDLKTMDRGIRSMLRGDMARAEQLLTEAKAMSAGNDPAGGYWVMPQMSSEVNRVMLETTPLLRYVRIVDLDPTDTFEEIVDKDAAEIVWVGENDPRGDTATPDLGKFTVTLHEVYAQPKVTQKLLDTASFNAPVWLQDKLGEAFGFGFGASVIGGDGVARPRGFLTYDIASTGDSARPWGTLQYVPTGASGALKAANADPLDFLDDTVAALKPQYRAGAVWTMNRSTAARLRKAKDTQGMSLWQPATQAGMPALLKGYPVIEDDQMPDVGADSLSIAFGNLRRGYTMVRRLGFRFLVDPYTDKPNVKFYAYQRVGGAVSNSEAIKLVRFSVS